ncbi:MAG: hypothetical protein ABI340_08455 [Nitrososphaera sp.]
MLQSWLSCFADFGHSTVESSIVLQYLSAWISRRKSLVVPLPPVFHVVILA